LRVKANILPSFNRRNFHLGVANGAFFRLAETLIDREMVLTWFLAQLNVSNIWVGLITPLRMGSSFILQLFVSGYLERKPYKLPFYGMVSIFRCTILLVWAYVIARIPITSSWLILGFFICLILFSLGSGLVGIPFMDITAKVIPPNRRGAFFSQRLFWGGVLGIGASWFIGYMLSAPGGLHFPVNVAWLIGLASFFWLLTAICWMLIKEPPGQIVRRRNSWFRQFRRGFLLLRDDANYRMYALVRFMLSLSSWATPFYIVYAKSELQISPQLIGLYLGARTTASILSNLIWGRISDRAGNRTLLRYAIVVGLAMPGLALLIGMLHRNLPGGFSWLSYAFTLVFIASGAYTAATGVGMTNFMLDLAPPGKRPLYLAFNSTLFGFIAFASFLGGVIVESSGFTILIVFSACCFLGALVLSGRLVEPRKQPETA
jgi:MFS family permease